MLGVKNTTRAGLSCAEKCSGLRALSTHSNVKISSEDNSTPFDQEWHNARPYKEVPKPSKFGLIRSFLPGGKLHNKSLSDYAMMSRKVLGDIFVIPGTFGKSDLLMVFKPEHIEKVYRTEGTYPYRASFDTVAHYRKELKNDFFGEQLGLATAQGETWFNLRKKVNPIVVQPRNAKLYINSLISVNDEFIQRIRDIRDSVTKEVPADFEEDLTRLTFESITSIVLNKQFGLIRRQKDNPDALLLFKNVRNFLIYLFQLEIQPSMWKTFRTPKYHQMMNCQEEIFTVTEKFINEALMELETKHKNSEQLEQEPSILEKLLKIDKKIAIIVAMDFLLAGVDGTSTVLAGVLLAIAKNPQKQEILRKEIMNILPEKDSPLTVESMKNLPYLRACIKESMRFYPVAAGSFRSTGRDIVLGGYQIPKGTNTLLNSNLMLLDENYYSRPREFIPERWLRRNEGAEVIQDKSHPFSFVPFGFGPRNCVGKRIVDIQFEVCLAKVLRNFRVEYNYSTENAFRQYFINVPAIPLKFKYIDVE